MRVCMREGEECCPETSWFYLAHEPGAPAFPAVTAASLPEPAGNPAPSTALQPEALARDPGAQHTQLVQLTARERDPYFKQAKGLCLLGRRGSQARVWGCVNAKPGALPRH